MDANPFSGFGLQSVSLNDRARFESYFQNLAEPLSDYTFAQLYTWGNSLRILWTEIDRHLCVFANGTGDLTLLMPPIGDGDPSRALREAFDVMNVYNNAHGVPDRSRVEYVSEELLARFDRSRFHLEPMGFDYLYDTARMIDLAGGDLASKRQLKNRFMRNYEYAVEPYDPARHLEPCRQLLKLWRNLQDSHEHCNVATTDALKRHKESLACELTLESADTLGLKGQVVFVRPRDSVPDLPAQDPSTAIPHPSLPLSLRGFTFGEPIAKDQASILIEKTDLGVKGLAQFIFSEFCARDWSHRPLINAGDDWGLESLAWTKMSYRPVKLLHKYTLRLPKPVAVAVNPSLAPEPTAPAPMNIRAATKSDLVAALDLENACFTDHRLTKRQLHYLQSRKSCVFLLAERDGKLLGQGIALIRTHKKKLSGRIYSLSVSPDARGQGIGKDLLQAMLDTLTSRGVQRIYLEVDDENAAAISLYEKTGFRRIGTLPDYYADGQHAVHMMYEVRDAVPVAA